MLRPSLCLALLGLVASLPTPAAASDALPLMRQMESAMQSPGEIVSVQMHLAFADGRSETRNFKMWTHGGGGEQARMLLKFEAPAAIAGTALLMHARKGGATDNWMYVPALRQTRRIAPQDRSDSFVQSQFTIEDLTVQVDAERGEDPDGAVDDVPGVAGMAPGRGSGGEPDGSGQTE